MVTCALLSGSRNPALAATSPSYLWQNKAEGGCFLCHPFFFPPRKWLACVSAASLRQPLESKGWPMGRTRYKVISGQ